jgi:hypothetical protein
MSPELGSAARFAPSIGRTRSVTGRGAADRYTPGVPAYRRLGQAALQAERQRYPVATRLGRDFDGLRPCNRLNTSEWHAGRRQVGVAAVLSGTQRHPDAAFLITIGW